MKEPIYKFRIHPNRVNRPKDNSDPVKTAKRRKAEEAREPKFKEVWEEDD